MREQYSVLKSGGTLRFWGEWFGRPYDNFHRVQSAQYDTATYELFVYFEGEVLRIKQPYEICNTEREFYVVDAEEISWQWSSYGELVTKDNQNFIIYHKNSDGTFYKNYRGTEKRFAPTEPKAIELLSY